MILSKVAWLGWYGNKIWLVALWDLVCRFAREEQRDK